MAKTLTRAVGAPVLLGWMPGGTVSRYRLLAKIATGGMAEIWLARQAGPRGFEKTVVVKRILESFAEDPAFVEMFLDEARIAAQLNHPNIVHIFDLGEHGGGYFIAMEYVHGESLFAVMRASDKAGTPIPLAGMVRLIADAASGLHCAHSQTGFDGRPLEIIHRDISPQNLIVSYDGELKILDFGIARAANRSSRTTAGQLKGKTSYLSPEQVRGLEFDARSDIFSLGVVLFECVTRTRLYPDDQFQALAAIGGKEPAPRARSRDPEIPEDLEAIVARAVAKDPAERFPSASALHQALEDWLGRRPQVTPKELAGHMQVLFRDRIAERLTLLDASAGSSSNLARSTTDTGSVTAVFDDAKTVATPQRAGRWIWAAVAVAVIAAGAAGGLALRPGRPQATASQPPPERKVTTLARSSLTIESAPPGATIRVDGVERGLAPVTLEGLPVGEHQVAAVLEGRLPALQSVRIERDGGRTTLVLTLPPGEEHRPAPKPPRKAVAKGKLTLDTSPWSTVYWNQKKLGDTPVTGYSLPAGRHTLTLINEAEGIKTAVEVEISAGQTTTKRLRLRLGN